MALLLPSGPVRADFNGADFTHGQQQLARLLEDRPALGRQLQDQDPLRTWATVQFAGAATGFRVYWDATLPPDGINAQHRQPWSGQPAVLLHPVHQSGSQRGQQKGFQDGWADVIFEFHNIARSRQFRDAFEAALGGLLGYGGWLESVTRIEHQALIDSANFHRTRWRPWARQQGRRTVGQRWREILRVPAAYADWIWHYRGPNGYPHASYGRYFVEHIRPALRASGVTANPFELSVIDEPDTAELRSRRAPGGALN